MCDCNPTVPGPAGERRVQQRGIKGHIIPHGGAAFINAGRHAPDGAAGRAATPWRPPPSGSVVVVYLTRSRERRLCFQSRPLQQHARDRAAARPGRTATPRTHRLLACCSPSCKTRLGFATKRFATRHTRWCGCTSRKRGGTMDTASWRVMPPLSFSRFMKSCTAASASSLRSCARLASICHASLRGYHGSGRGGRSSSPPTCIRDPALCQTKCLGMDAVPWRCVLVVYLE